MTRSASWRLAALDQVVHGDRPLAFGVGFAGLPGHTVGMAMDQLVQTELVGQFDGDDAIGWVRLRGESSQERGLAGIGAARDDHVQPCLHRGTQETGQFVAERIGQVVEGGVNEAVPPDGHTRSVGDLDHGRESVPTGEMEIDDGLGAVDAALSAGVVRPGGTLDQFDQVFVAVRNGFDTFFDAVGPFDPDVVGAIDVDVLDVVLVQEELQATETQLGRHQAANDLVLFLGARRGHAALDHRACRFVDGLAGQLLDEGTAIDFAHSGGPVVDDPFGHVLGGIALELAAFGVVHCCAFPFDPAPTAGRVIAVSHDGVLWARVIRTDTGSSMFGGACSLSAAGRSLSSAGRRSSV